MLNELLSKQLEEVCNLLTPEEYAEEYGVELKDILEDIKKVNEGYDLDIVGLLSLKPGYEDNNGEVEGSFYGSDGVIYFMYGWPDWRVVNIDEESALESIEEEDI